MKKFLSLLLIITFLVALSTVFAVPASAAGPGGGGGGESIKDLAGTKWVLKNGLPNINAPTISASGRYGWSSWADYSTFKTSYSFNRIGYSSAVILDSTYSDRPYLRSNSGTATIYYQGGFSYAYGIDSEVHTYSPLLVEFDNVSVTNSDVVSYFQQNFYLLNPPAPTSFTITFNASPYTFSGGSSTYTVDVEDGGVRPGLLDIPVPQVPSGSSFLGWYSSATGGTQYQSGDFVTEDETWYAHYRIPLYISWDTNGGLPSTLPDTVVYPDSDGKYILPSKIPSASKEGATFVAWEYVGLPYIAGAEFTANRTYTAHWSTDNGTITFVTRKSGISPPSAIENVSKIPWNIDTYLPTPVAYTSLEAAGWIGWVDENGNAPVPNTPISGDVTFYGVWEEDTHTITYDDGTGDGGGSQYIPPTYGDTIPEDLPHVEREGYVFDGWYWDSEFTHPVIPGTPIYFDKTIYAKYILVGATDPGEGDEPTVDPGSQTIIGAVFNLFDSVIDVTIFYAEKLFGGNFKIYGTPLLSFMLLGAVAAIIASGGDDD